MASSVFYKWASRKDESRVTFDGTGITVFDLKREIILANNLVKGVDFDVHVYDTATKQEFKDDTHIIPRSTSVLVKRLPVFRPAKTRIPIYLGNAPGGPVPTSETVVRGNASWHKGSMSKRFDGKEEPPTKAPAPVAAPVTSAVVKEDEAAAMAAIFSAQTQNWEETQEKMSHATYITREPRGASSFARGGKPHPTSDRPLPASYVCYRCGQKGHWIQDCPTNNDREFDNRPRIKRTTGIPRSMLKAVENPNSADIGQGVMVTPDGGYVVAQPDSKKIASLDKLIVDTEARARTSAYIDKLIEESRKDAEGSVNIDPSATGEGDDQEQDIYSDQQPDMFSQALVDSIPQLQASIAQISKMLQNPNLPANVRHQTEMQHQQLQMQLQEAQMMALAFSAYQQQQQQQQQQAQALANNYGQQFQQQQSWTSQYISQQPGPESAYQRLPVNNRRRNLKRDRPSDFLEVGGDGDAGKVARYWE
ncbi:hypothetical protein H1R20_g12818, partial [Candolleomyces eurysporus]